VVLEELFGCDTAVRAITLHYVEGGLEGLEELYQHLVGGALAGEDIGMLGSVEHLFDVLTGDASVVSIGLESPLNGIHTVLAHFAANSV